MEKERVKFSFSKCMDMAYTVCYVNKDWYDKHSDLSPEVMYELCHKEPEKSLAGPKSQTTWYGLG